MNNNWKITLIGWAGFIIMLVLFLQRCGAGINTTNTIVKSDTTTVQKFDTIIKTIKVIVKKPSDSIIIKIPAKVDTVKILQRFYNKYFYSQVVSDTNIVATFSDTVSQNKIIWRGFQYKLLKPKTTTTIVNTTTIIPNKRALYFGAFIQSNTIGTQIGCGPQLQFVTKKNTLYNAGYDFLQKQIRLGASIKLGKRANS